MKRLLWGYGYSFSIERFGAGLGPLESRALVVQPICLYQALNLSTLTESFQNKKGRMTLKNDRGRRRAVVFALIN